MLTADQVINAISLVLDDIVRLSKRVRVVGTASSSLRGIVLPVADIDILGRDRATVDELVAASASPPATLIETPFGRQYLAEHRLGGVPVQFSTVESDASWRPGWPNASARHRGATSRWWTWTDTPSPWWLRSCVWRRT